MDYVQRRHQSDSLQVMDFSNQRIWKVPSAYRLLGWYVVSDKFIIKKYRPTPYFFTEDDILRFAACDHVVLGKRHQGRHLVIPGIFRFLYCCGVRELVRQDFC